MRRVGTGLVGVFAVALVSAFMAAPALASTVTLNVAPNGSGSTCSSADPCSLQTGLDAVTSASDAYVIDLAAGNYPVNGGYTIGLGGIGQSLTMTGAGTASTVLSGGFIGSEPQEAGHIPLDDAASYPVTITDMTIENGYATSGVDGADVFDSSPDQATLDDDVINGGEGETGYDLVDTTQGPLEIENSTVENAQSNNFDLTGGAGANGSTASLTVENSTFEDNPAGDVSISEGAAGTIYDSTLVGETASGIGAVSNGGTGKLAVYDSTFSDDADAFEALGTGNGGAAVAIEFGADILAGTANCQAGDGGTYTDLGENVETDASCPAIGGMNDKQDVSAASLALGPLANNGGPTETEKITSASAAYHLAATGGLINLACGDEDQRGMPREEPGASKCDVGAYSVAPPTLKSAAPAGGESGYSVELTGTNLSDVTSVTFGSEGAAITARSQTSLMVTVPALPEGSAPIAAANSDGTASLAFSVTGPLISTHSLPSGRLGAKYSQQIAGGGGTPPFTWRVASGKLPGGLSLSSTGVISGKPTATGTFKFTISVTDADGETATSSLSLTVPRGVVTIKSSKLSVKKSRIGVSISCASDQCAGSVKLAGSRGKGLASGSYHLSSGGHETVELKLTKAGGKAFKHASKRKPVKAELSVTVTGGTTVRRGVKVA